MSTKSKQTKSPSKPAKVETIVQTPVEVKTEINTETPIIVEPQTIELAPIPEPVIATSLPPVEPKKISYEYKIVVARNNLDLFEFNVTEHLNSGWELSGGVSCTIYADSYSASTIWSQAVYKKTSN